MTSDTPSGLDVTLGWSSQKNSKQAVAQALEPLNAAAGAGPFGLVLVYASVKQDLNTVVAQVHAAVGDVPLMGCTTTGEICNGGLLSGGIALAGIRGEGFRAAVGYGRNVFGAPEQAGRAAVEMATKALGGADALTGKALDIRRVEVLGVGRSEDARLPAKPSQGAFP